MSRITVQYSDVIVNFGYDRPLGGYWADVFSAQPVDADYEKQDREPLHEFPSTYPFRLAESIGSIRDDLSAVGIDLPIEALNALRTAGHEFGDEVYFRTDLDYLTFAKFAADGSVPEEVWS